MDQLVDWKFRVTKKLSLSVNGFRQSVTQTGLLFGWLEYLDQRKAGLGFSFLEKAERGKLRNYFKGSFKRETFLRPQNSKLSPQKMSKIASFSKADFLFYCGRALWKPSGSQEKMRFSLRNRGFPVSRRREGCFMPHAEQGSPPNCLNCQGDLCAVGDGSVAWKTLLFWKYFKDWLKICLLRARPGSPGREAGGEGDKL